MILWYNYQSKFPKSHHYRYHTGMVYFRTVLWGVFWLSASHVHFLFTSLTVATHKITSSKNLEKKVLIFQVLLIVAAIFFLESWFIPQDCGNGGNGIEPDPSLSSTPSTPFSSQLGLHSAYSASGYIYICIWFYTYTYKYIFIHLYILCIYIYLYYIYIYVNINRFSWRCEWYVRINDFLFFRGLSEKASLTGCHVLCILYIGEGCFLVHVFWISRPPETNDWNPKIGSLWMFLLGTKGAFSGSSR